MRSRKFQKKFILENYFYLFFLKFYNIEFYLRTTESEFWHKLLFLFYMYFWIPREVPNSLRCWYSFSSFFATASSFFFFRQIWIRRRYQGSKSLVRIVWIDRSQNKSEYWITHSSIVIGTSKERGPMISNTGRYRNRRILYPYTCIDTSHILVRNYFIRVGGLVCRK